MGASESKPQLLSGLVPQGLASTRFLVPKTLTDITSNADFFEYVNNVQRAVEEAVAAGDEEARVRNMSHLYMLVESVQKIATESGACVCDPMPPFSAEMRVGDLVTALLETCVCGVETEAAVRRSSPSSSPFSAPTLQQRASLGVLPTTAAATARATPVPTRAKTPTPPRASISSGSATRGGSVASSVRQIVETDPETMAKQIVRAKFFKSGIECAERDECMRQGIEWEMYVDEGCIRVVRSRDGGSTIEWIYVCPSDPEFQELLSVVSRVRDAYQRKLDAESPSSFTKTPTPPRLSLRPTVPGSGSRALTAPILKSGGSTFGPSLRPVSTVGSGYDASELA